MRNSLTFQKLGLYILNRRKRPVRCPEFLEWAAWMHHNNKIVRVTKVNRVEVSTVFLGIDHNHARVGKPILFETMIFGGKHEGFQCRYRTWAEAVRGHKTLLVSIAKRQPLR